MYDISNRIAVITGAGKGIGRAIAERFVKEEPEGLALLDYDFELVSKTAAQLDPTGKKVVPVECNVADPESVHAAFEKVRGIFGRVDILINNAGITRDCMFHKMSPEQMHAVMDVNFFGVYNCCTEVIPGMRERAYGKIVNISSTSSYGNVGQANYSASKGAIEGFTRTLAKESGRKNITVNAILPGCIDTEMMRAVPEANLKAILAGHPMQRLGQPSEVAALVMFLASDESSYISGECIITSGAYIIH